MLGGGIRLFYPLTFLIMKWKTKTGEVLDVKDMSTSHIKNCIKMVEKQLAQLDDGQVYTGDSDLAQQWVEMENEKTREMISIGKRIIRSFKNELYFREKGLYSDYISVPTICNECGELDPVKNHACNFNDSL